MLDEPGTGTVASIDIGRRGPAGWHECVGTYDAVSMCIDQIVSKARRPARPHELKRDDRSLQGMARPLRARSPRRSIAGIFPLRPPCLPAHPSSWLTTCPRRRPPEQLACLLACWGQRRARANNTSDSDSRRRRRQAARVAEIWPFTSSSNAASPSVNMHGKERGKAGAPLFHLAQFNKPLQGSKQKRRERFLLAPLRDVVLEAANA